MHIFGRHTYMHPLEKKLVESLESGIEPTVQALGGVTQLLRSSGALATSPLMPEFMRIVLANVTTDAHEGTQACQFIARCLEKATDAFVWTEALDLLDHSRPLPEPLDEIVFRRCLSIAEDKVMSAMTRAVGLDGALRWSFDDRRRQLRLTLVLLDVAADDDPDFVNRAAKIIGFAYAHWREKDFISRLKLIASGDEVAEEALFELGMAALVDGFNAGKRESAHVSFATALRRFREALIRSPERPDALMYAASIETLLAFSAGESAVQLQELAVTLSSAAFELHAWRLPAVASSWLQIRRIEAAIWTMLALKLQALAEDLESVAWWEPAAVIEEHLLSVYASGRAVFRNPHSPGLATLIRPRIENALISERWQAHLLKHWIKLNPSNAWHDEAETLLARVDAAVSEECRLTPDLAVIKDKSIAALLSNSDLPPAIKIAIGNAMNVHLSNMTGAEQEVIQDCLQEASILEDFRDNQAGQKLFSTILLWTVRFLASRLDLTQADAPSVKYLFERPPGSLLPREHDLQTDYFNLMVSNVLGTEIEISNIGGGRADLRFTYAPEKLVVEIKRENRDASFDALTRSYGAQTTDYQNVTVRLGFLLVLDQTQVRTSGTPHLSSLVRPVMVRRPDECEPRLVVIVKVPGRRLRPSDLTKLPKKAPKKV